MRREPPLFSAGNSGRNDRRGSVLIIVIWVCLGLVALTLYFANSMSAELRAADNRVEEMAAQQAVGGGTRYAAYLLKQYAAGGAVPHVEDYKAEMLPVGDGAFWFIGRDNSQTPTTEPVFGFVDEASKLNLNSASRSMLEALPGITPELVDAILTWRRRSGDPVTGDAGGGDPGGTYSQLTPPRTNKGGQFESLDELRLVYGATLDILFGEDTNRNGALDPNEDDGDQSAPRDDQNGILLAGITEYLTAWSREPARTPDGQRRVNITTPQGRGNLNRVLQRQLDPSRAAEIMRRVGDRTFNSVAQFMLESDMTADEFARVHSSLTHRDGTVTGLVNINTASETVLSCIPGIGVENAGTIVAYRLANPDVLTSFAWMRNVLSRDVIVRAGPYITDQSYQFSADVAGVGRLGRGYCREKTIFDMSTGTPRIIYHQDLTSYGWALGANARQASRNMKENGT